MIRQVITTVTNSNYLVIDNSSNHQDDTVRILISDFVNSITGIIDNTFLPLAGGTMVGPLSFDATVNGIMHNSEDDEIRISLTPDTVAMQAGGSGDAVFTMTKSSKSILTAGEYFSFQSWDDATIFQIDNANKSITMSVDTGNVALNITETYADLTINGATCGFYFDNTNNVSMYNGSSNFTIQADETLRIITKSNTLNSLKIQHLKTYADNTAAVLAGETLESVYKTATGELRIVV
jgi:hypothetical protein